MVLLVSIVGDRVAQASADLANFLGESVFGFRSIGRISKSGFVSLWVIYKNQQSKLQWTKNSVHTTTFLCSTFWRLMTIWFLR